MTSPQTQTRHADQSTPAEAGNGQADRKRSGGKVVHLHTAHPRVPIPYVTPGDMFSGARKATSTAATSAAATATSLVPSPRKLAFYGLLGGMTVAGAMAWPVAVAVGAATEVITREQSSRHRQQHEHMERDHAQDQEGPPSTTGRADPGTTGRTVTG
ncbi:hypothetical protein [Streptomyces sp. NPDC098781]|uniref:hypothetical protein n=1 Tax=Streptomyces sp. NPDC098781 TaxID=3366097 RepID=UPI00381EC0ED